ncbi:hypothetical protein [Chryseobacterium lathyri]|uniref:hypothetical protein n=1 Tax=Chryseobacterium lathyri TaxID=395933 RepID=UPI00278021D6|nr:hypothetical protein [Chryseobacterium lathyri]MDQ0064390.1 hypothetical protein [Chryseobacterium lathyri]
MDEKKKTKSIANSIIITHAITLRRAFVKKKRKRKNNPNTPKNQEYIVNPKIKSLNPMKINTIPIKNENKFNLCALRRSILSVLGSISRFKI